MIYLTIPHGSTAVRLSQVVFRGRARIDLREHFSPVNETTLLPTRKGVSLPIEQLPLLREALERAEADAIKTGLLTPADYETVGILLPTAIGATS